MHTGDTSDTVRSTKPGTVRSTNPGTVQTFPFRFWRRYQVLGLPFGIAPHVRFQGQPGEQATMFFRDPSGNALEFKAFADDAMLFAT